MELANIIHFADISANPAKTPILFSSTSHIPCTREVGGSFTEDSGGCVKEGSEDGQIPP